MKTLMPNTPDQVQEAVRWAFETATPLDLQGLGTKSGLGRPGSADHMLCLSGLSGVTLYEPEELVMKAMAGTPLAEIEMALEEKGQRLAFEPPNLAGLFGSNSSGTIGGIFASNLSGPRRVWSGAARDHILGVSLINGRGELVKSGGRVVKNVTGFDLSKLLAGSYGTLGALTEVAFKVLPKGERERTVLLRGVGIGEAEEVLNLAMRGPFELSGAAYLPASIAACVGHSRSLIALRFEGPEPSVDAKGRALRCLLGAFGEVRSIDQDESGDFWRAIRDVAVFANDRDKQIWRLSVPPANAAAVIGRLPDELKAEWFLDRAGGLIWLAMPPRRHAGQELVRAAIGQGGGHATLIRAAEEVRSTIDVFHPQPKPVAALSKRIKAAFDPSFILSPGRMFGEV